MKPRQKQLNFIQRAGMRILFGSQKNTMGVGDGFERGINLFNNASRPTYDELSGFFDDKDENLFKGYLFAAIRNRANAVAQLATEHIKTRWDDEKKTDDHPYLAVIDNSKFSNYFFWNAQPYFLDLKGVSYMLAVRNVTENRVGAIQYFDILNPYHINKNINDATGEYIYTETRKGRVRKIPEDMLITAKTMNPFDLEEGMDIIGAARDAQTLNQKATDYTRNALKKNVGQRGLLSTDVILEPEDFENLKAAVEASAQGEFIYSNGGALKYEDMQIDLDKLALQQINATSLEQLFAVTGLSRTAFGIEQSGITRDTSKTQTERLMRDHTIPTLQVMIDALNQDYRWHYPDEYDQGKPELYIDSPLNVDREADLADANTFKAKAQAAQILISSGFDPDKVVEEVGLPPITFVGIPEPIVVESENKVVKNVLAPQLESIVEGKRTTLENDVQNIQRKIVTSAAKNYRESQNALTEDDLLTKEEREEYETEIEVLIAAFFASVIPLFATQTTRERFKQFQLPSAFKMTPAINKFIKAHAEAVAASHINTVMGTIYKAARAAQADGLGIDEATRKIYNAYNDTISKEQARRIAQTESNRSMAQAQYEADKQFIKQNNLGARAYKQWITRSANPCPYCTSLASQPPIPFGDAFIGKNGSITVDEDGTTRTYVANFETIESGTLHPHCQCIYTLIIR